ncbi:chromosome partitioning protein ParB [Variovorax paradoxus]|jgi:ParB family chromosome partitioning protein|uniref:ParB/RepB/Spo0J family partition protein n=1 Tax=Variovorax TaxID=34072 RepID=UPI0006E60763|nr:ParB/RepB/Spo0J family partition protein [Variovorax sp.]KPU94625.1 chromosome partitioning protein ParB [Variovorax paradoxus]KPU94946.1 chromosome partitioning protein ParB [Variovorax paradoxus]KPU96170.1 chromosome partitioning protein ParB [Variovorax paradoxus]KPV15113.1 chromosome partitioning protein ParB [Variovorax paradoxus]KPV30004.1 chromosome partitioning protein ParB [Variovorax paradoxus]
MNTVSHSEVQAVAAAAAAAASAPAQAEAQATTVPEVAPYELHLIALSKLRPSNRNVRKSGGTSIPSLASSILRVGLLQNLTVIASPDGESFEVVAGKRRLAALKLLAKRRRIGRDHPVPCLLVPDASARTVSLTENVQRVSMGAIEELRAWKALAAEGRAIEDIAADFGVTPLVVRRRLRLANVSPRLLSACEAGEVSIEQLMALAITDDHKAQEAAWFEAPQWQRSPDALREHLTQDEIDASRDPVARFVGVETYEAAGGGIRRDLFADEQNGVFLADAGLLESLARDQLEAVADAVRAEGWRWVEAVPRATSAELHQFQRARPTRRAPGKAEAKRIAKLEAEQARIRNRLHDEDTGLSDGGAQALHEELDRLRDERDAIEQGLLVYAPGVVPLAGAVVSIDHAGALVVHRGLLREEQAKALREQARQEVGQASDASGSGDGAADAEPMGPGISEKLARRLSAHRTVALQAEVARHPRVALVALVHVLAHRVILDGYGGASINISASPQDRLSQIAPDIDESPAAQGLERVREAWVARLPSDPEALFGELLAMEREELLSLLALCVGRTVAAFASKETEVPALALARAVGLDMHGWWTPTAAGYFGHVSKAKALEAVRVFAPGEVHRLAKLKKAQIAAEAERLAAGSGWLPAMFRTPEEAAIGQADAEPEVEAGAEAEIDVDAEGAEEEAHATA